MSDFPSSVGINEISRVLGKDVKRVDYDSVADKLTIFFDRTLSDRLNIDTPGQTIYGDDLEKIRQFIKELKDGLTFDHDDMPQAVQERQDAIDLIDKLAGDKLI